MDQVRLVQSVDRPGQGVVIAVAPAANRRPYTCLSEPLSVSNGDLLRASVRMMNETVRAPRLTVVQRLLQRIEHEVGSHGAADPPADNAPGKQVNHEGHVEPTLPGRNVSKVRHPQLVRPIGFELPIHTVKRTGCRLIRYGGSRHLATTHSL